MKDDNQALIHRPWGGYTVLKKTPLFWIKKLFVNTEARLSLQSHQHRSEVWVVLRGAIHALIGEKWQRADPGDVLFIPRKKKHRIMGITDACILEIAFGRVLEKDIIRYEDDYGRSEF
ncbi:MAG: hypothetical protein A3F41_06400 [Coxiella sp. RIFCSPHIGHO2_12_FULL_44_14]|nr:MAG: hypothetical protein A3F41_06400 [Coxiella sp. RIFCSPHIGHO2_12_FULL_44_14]